MDIYAIGRMLRDFTPKRSSEGSAFTGTSQNVIYYAGYYHVHTFVDFLTRYMGLEPEVELGDAVPYKRRGQGARCLSFVAIDIRNTSF